MCNAVKQLYALLYNHSIFDTHDSISTICNIHIVSYHNNGLTVFGLDSLADMPPLNPEDENLPGAGTEILLTEAVLEQPKESDAAEDPEDRENRSEEIPDQAATTPAEEEE